MTKPAFCEASWNLTTPANKHQKKSRREKQEGEDGQGTWTAAFPEAGIERDGRTKVACERPRVHALSAG